MIYMAEIDFSAIEKKWQEKWEKAKCFYVKEEKNKKKYYVVEMYPYPSGSGLHIGHAFNYTIGDICARFKLMQGYNVLHPMGFDSFGLPAENAAIKAKSHPKKFTQDAISMFIKQQKSLGLTYDWDRMIMSHSPEYYKWDQWIFLKMFEKNLAYKKKATVNWCSKCGTVLANEQVHSGMCWRHNDTAVELKHLDQWFFKITDYADELYEDVDKLAGWPPRIKAMQKNWIGKSFGTEINFKINKEDWKIFTTRPDTIYGVTFMVVSAQHPRLSELVTKEQKKEVDDFLKKIKSTSEKDAEELEKEGAFTGSYAINPLTNEKVPVYTGNFVVADYGAGMVMAVPAHDERDFQFAKKYNIPIKNVIAPNFILSGKNSPRKDVETLERNTVTAIIEHPTENKFLLLKETDNTILVGGGIEKNETPEDAIKREIKEETGYLNFEIKKVLIDNLFCFGYRKSKNKNQKTNDVVFYIKLKNDKKIKSEIEDGKHEAIWVNKNEVQSKINWEHHRFMWNLFNNKESAYTSDGILINSNEFNGLDNKKAIDEITQYLTKKKLGKKTVNYKLRDWLISRQRFWGTPIPIIYCDKCGAVPVQEKDLPVVLPENIKFESSKNPLIDNKKFTEVKCPKCNGKARRETDTMDTFVNSSWYFFRYCDSKNNKEIFDTKKSDYWMPIDQYIGGAEHACMHLIYSRFYTKFFRDIGLTKINEPTLNLFNQGMVHGKDGVVMSKSRGNVVDPLDMIKKYSCDTLRIFLVSIASPDSDSMWSDTGIESMHKFIKKFVDYYSDVKIGKSSAKVESKINKAIKEITEDIEKFRYNLAVIKLRGLLDVFTNEKEIGKKDLENYLKLISPFCPHIAEELWSKLKNKEFISLEKWPVCDEKKINEKLEQLEQAAEKTINDIQNVLRIIKEKQGKEGEKIYLYVMPFELSGYNNEDLTKRIQKPVKVFAVNDKNKYDPENKASKAKPGKPGIFIE